MPLRDHFRSPLDDLTSWEGFYGGWPAMMVLALVRILPLRYLAAPRVHLGSFTESDEASYEYDEANSYEYEVRIYDSKRGRRLVAAIEIVSPANKDRPEHRRAFVAKCAGLLQNFVSVAIIDLVTTRNFNLYGELLEAIGRGDAPLEPEPPPLYAAACRLTKKEDACLLETWAHTLTLGGPLPTLPLWLADNLAVPLELEPCYEETCRVLRIP
jgi:Protein of unknown function (DUF4058)